MNMQQIEQTIQDSPKWKKATDAINSVVDQANRAGRKMPEEERRLLGELRLCATILNDDAVMDAVAEHTFNQLQEEINEED